MGFIGVMRAMKISKNIFFTLQKTYRKGIKNFDEKPEKKFGAPAGIRTRVFGSKGRNDWPDYTTGAHRISQRDQQYTL